MSPLTLMFSGHCSVSMHTYAVMGVNTALIQAALVTRARVYTVLAERLEANLDMIKNNYKIDFLHAKEDERVATALYVYFFSPNILSPSFEMLFC